MIKKLVLILILFFMPVVSYAYYPLNKHIEPMIKTKEHNYREADYVNAYCNGDIEYILNDKTRVDCLTDRTHAK